MFLLNPPYPCSLSPPITANLINKRSIHHLGLNSVNSAVFTDQCVSQDRTSVCSFVYLTICFFKNPFQTIYFDHTSPLLQLLPGPPHCFTHPLHSFSFSGGHCFKCLFCFFQICFNSDSHIYKHGISISVGLYYPKFL